MASPLLVRYPEGAAIRQARERDGHSREWLGELAGRSAQTVGLWETGRVRPPRSVLVKLAAALGLTLVDLGVDE